MGRRVLAAVFLLAAIATGSSNSPSAGASGAVGLTPGGLSAGSAVRLGQQMAAQPPYGWTGSQFTCLNWLWTRESGWQWNATNGTSGAYGIPQSLPAGKMAAAGGDWQTNPATQIKWGLGYIASTYGTPCNAWSHEESDGWY